MNHVDRQFDIFDPSPLWTVLLNKAYVVIWTVGKPPSPTMSTWFMNAPLTELGMHMQTMVFTKN